ncbi:MAG: YdbH domain-containing protein [Terricaulis sp.]
MAHRSNQAVASQEKAAPSPEGAPSLLRHLAGWATAFAALGVATGLLGGALWLVRFSAAEFFIGAALAERGVDADFEVVALDFSSAALTQIRIGDEALPDAEIERLDMQWTWRGLRPALSEVRLIEPVLNLSLLPDGRISAGSLQRINDEPGIARPRLSAIKLSIERGLLRVTAPNGRLEASIAGDGVLGRDFAAALRAAPATLIGDAYAVRVGATRIDIASRDGGLAMHLQASAESLEWRGARLRNVALRVAAAAPLSLATLDADANWRASAVAAGGAKAEMASGGATLHAQMQERQLAPATWRGQARASARTIILAGMQVDQPIWRAQADGEGETGRGAWSLDARRFAGAGLISRHPSGAGDVDLAATGELSGRAQLVLADSRLSEASVQALMKAFPQLDGAPVAPSFASARQALLRAGRAFTLTAPLAWEANEGRMQVRAAGPLEALASSGTRLRLTPLRQDTPALTLQWPGSSLHAAMTAELSGGGAPTATLLLDALDWAPDAPIEAEGALRLADWNAAGASIAADELDVSLSLPPGRGGRLELRGPVQVSGPVGAGRVSGLAADLDITATWDRGWRLASNSRCLPMRFASLEAAGLSFSNAALSLCPLDGALIAARADGTLSGGFQIQTPRLSGQLRGGAPAQASAHRIVGRFHGDPGDMRLRIEANAPTLRIAFDERRTLALSLQRLRADARLAADWRFEGEFEQGALADPGLPGTITAIAGAWSAAPEDGAPVVHVEAGEALVTANQPATTAERPLFNPMRLSDVGATLRGGRIDASGAVVLEAQTRQLARFLAAHELEQGAGSAHAASGELVFGGDFQPYHLTERLRGMVENVRGPAEIAADISWTSQRVSASGTVRLNGVSMATATIPIVEGVRGAVFFDDLFALTTPPGQSVSVGMVNPGVAVRDGRVQFQLLGQQRVAIERAEFAYAGGVLAMAPTTISLGADETQFELTLAEVDAADLIASLNVPDITASGRVEGNFPLLLSRRTALIQNGVLRALPGGGTISYVGHAGDGATGPARIAFDALRSFHYDELEITLDGDLGGEVISSITFSGENTGEPVDLGPIAPIPGLGNVQVRGVPFDFNVRVTAPFRRLADTAASIADPGMILDRGQAQEENEPVDQTSPAPR